MNNRGQSFILFILLIPILILIFSFFIESANILYNDTKIKDIIEDSCKYEEWEEYILKNDKDVSISYGKEIVIEKDIDSLFSKIIGIKTFHIKELRVCGGEENE